jgi:hypothetical protein
MTILKRLFACVSFAFAVFAADAMTLYWQGDFVPASGVETSPTEWQITLLDAGKVSREVVSAALASNDVEKLSQALELGKVYSTTGCTYSTTGDGYWVVQKAPISSDYEKTNSVTFYTLILDKAPAANQTGYYILTDLKTDNALTFGNQCTMALGDLSKAVWTAYPEPVSEDGTVNLFWSGISVPRTGIQTVPGNWEITLLDAAKVPRSEMASALASNDYTVISAALLKGMVVSTTGRVQNVSRSTSGKFGRWYWDNYSGKMPAEYTWAKYHETNSLSFYTLILDRKLDAKQTGHYILTEERATWIAQIGTQCQVPFGSFASAKWSGYTTSGGGSVDPEPGLDSTTLTWTGDKVELSAGQTEPETWCAMLMDANKVPTNELVAAFSAQSYKDVFAAINQGLVVSVTGIVTKTDSTTAQWSYTGAMPEGYPSSEYSAADSLRFYTLIMNRALAKGSSGRYILSREKTGKILVGASANTCTMEFGSLKLRKWCKYSLDSEEPGLGNLVYVATNVVVTYDGQGHGLSVWVKTPASGAMVEYARAAEGPWGGDVCVTNAGSLKVYYRILAANFKGVTNSASVTIVPRKVTLTSGSASKVVDGEALTNGVVTVSGNGFAAGEGASYEVTGAQVAVGSSGNSFTYTLDEGTLAGNYEITKVEGVLTVTDGTEPEPKPEPAPTSDRELAPGEDGAANLSAAEVYNGYIVDDEGALKGTIQVKAAKQKVNKKTGVATSKLTITVQMLGEKKVSIKGTMEDVEEGVFAGLAKDGRKVEIELGANGLSGTFDGYTIDGARDVFASKDKTEKAEGAVILNAFKAKGAVTLAWESAAGWNGLSLTVGTKGKTKVAGTLADGTKVSTSAQLIVGEDWYAVPVVYAKKSVSLAFIVWIARDDLEDVEVVGLGEDVEAGMLEGLGKSAAFSVDEGALAALFAVEKAYEEYFPEDVAVTVNGTKWVLPKAGKISMKKGIVDESKAGDNPAGLKLTYKAKYGTFSGSFKVYTGKGGSKMKAVTVSVSGILVEGKGYGTATVKKKGSVAVVIE